MGKQVAAGLKITGWVHPFINRQPFIGDQGTRRDADVMMTDKPQSLSCGRCCKRAEMPAGRNAP